MEAVWVSPKCGDPPFRPGGGTSSSLAPNPVKEAVSRPPVSSSGQFQNGRGRGAVRTGSRFLEPRKSAMSAHLFQGERVWEVFLPEVSRPRWDTQSPPPPRSGLPGVGPGDSGGNGKKGPLSVGSGAAPTPPGARGCDVGLGTTYPPAVTCQPAL